MGCLNERGRKSKERNLKRKEVKGKGALSVVFCEMQTDGLAMFAAVLWLRGGEKRVEDDKEVETERSRQSLDVTPCALRPATPP